MTGVQKAYEIDDWCQVLIDIPFHHVEKAMLEYMGTCENLTDHGTLRRIAPAAIRETPAAIARAKGARGRWMKQEPDGSWKTAKLPHHATWRKV